MDLAQGKHVLVIDYGAGKEFSRAIYKGVPLIRYALTRIWLERRIEITMTPRFNTRPSMNMRYEFNQIYNELPKTAKRYLARFKQFCSESMTTVNLEGISETTRHDGDKNFYLCLWREHFA